MMNLITRAYTITLLIAAIIAITALGIGYARQGAQIAELRQQQSYILQLVSDTMETQLVLLELGELQEVR